MGLWAKGKEEALEMFGGTQEKIPWIRKTPLDHLSSRRENKTAAPARMGFREKVGKVSILQIPNPWQGQQIPST